MATCAYGGRTHVSPANQSMHVGGIVKAGLAVVLMYGVVVLTGIPEASNRSRVTNPSPRSARDLFEAALNEAACGLTGPLWALEARTGT
jgi:hypothetical protein